MATMDDFPFDYRIVRFLDNYCTLLCRLEDKIPIQQYAAQNEYCQEIHPISPDKGYTFGYNLSEFILFRKGDCACEIIFQIPSFSLTEFYLIPLDKSIQKKAWGCYNIISGRKMLCSEVELIYRLSSAIFRDKEFSFECENWINAHLELLDNKDFILLLEKVFFKYTQRLVNHLKKGDFCNIFTDYLEFSQY